MYVTVNKEIVKRKKKLSHIPQEGPKNKYTKVIKDTQAHDHYLLVRSGITTL